MMKEALLELTGDIVAAHVSNNRVGSEELVRLIEAVYGSLAGLGEPEAPVEEERAPAVAVRSSVRRDAITCLECGMKQKTLKRHLQARHELSPEEYRARWKLPADYPMVAPDYAAKRSEMATSLGLGRKGGRKKKSEAAVAAPKADVSASAGTTASAPAPRPKRKLGIKAG